MHVLRSSCNIWKGICYEFGLYVCMYVCMYVYIEVIEKYVTQVILYLASSRYDMILPTYMYSTVYACKYEITTTPYIYIYTYIYIYIYRQREREKHHMDAHINILHYIYLYIYIYTTFELSRR